MTPSHSGSGLLWVPGIPMCECTNCTQSSACGLQEQDTNTAMPVPLPGGIGLGLHWAWVPLVGFVFGCATIISLLVIWLAQGHPRYRSDESTVVYISDVGADNHALFIVLGTLTAIFFFASIYLDYRLRHLHRIPVRVRRYERAASAISVIFAFICSLGCILLTIFDAFAHPTLHWTFSGIFFVALLISGLFNMIEIGGKSPSTARHASSMALGLLIICALHSIAQSFVSMEIGEQLST